MDFSYAIPLVSGLLTATGAWWWVKTHTHPDLVSRTELEGLKSLMKAQHYAVLRELEQLRNLL